MNRLQIIVLILIQSGMLILTSSCSAAQHMTPDQMTTNHAPPSTSSQSESGTEEQTAEPGLSPVVTGTIQPAESEADASMQEKLLAAPAVEGAEKVIADMNGLSRVIYVALPDNPYGVEADSFIGEYKHEVYLGEDRTGGVALAVAAAEVQLQKALEALPQQNPWLLTLPLDLSDCRSIKPVWIDLSAQPFIDRPYYIRISPAEEQIGVVNILDDQQQVVIDEFKMFGLHYVISERSLNSMRVIEGEEMAFLFVIARFKAAPQTDADYSFGDLVGMTSEPLLAGLTSVRGPMREHDYDCILKISGCPVFLIANKKSP